MDRIPRRLITQFERPALVVAALAGLLPIGLVAYTAIELYRFERTEASQAIVVYAAGQPLMPGLHVGLVDLANTLIRLNYTETRTPPVRPGQFQRESGTWEIFVRGAHGSDGQRVRLEIADGRVASVTRADEAVEAVTLEPEVLARLGVGRLEDSRPVRLVEVPLVVVNAFLAAEDQRFFEHGGVDLRGLVRAAWANLRAGRIRQGGSTITQQLVKNRLLGPERSWLRKLREAWLAGVIEWRHSKEEVLEAYLNEIYLGQRGPLAIRGVGAAARAYFGKDVEQLTLGEAALLAGMVRAPNVYSPALNPDRARERRNVVLTRMRELDMIDGAVHRRASRQAVRARPVATLRQLAPYFIDHVRQEVEQQVGSGALSDGPESRIFITLDQTLQRFAEAAVARGLDRLETHLPGLRRSDPGERLQAALLAVDPVRGEVRALVGGRDYQASQFNRATLARRQPGSAFKPFVYLAALSARQGQPTFTPASLVDDAPITLWMAGRSWSPQNYEGRYEGRVSVRRALEQSLNAATVRIAETVGLPAVIETARALGLKRGLKPVPSAALGAFEVTPIDLARAYLPLANGGLRPERLIALRRVDQGDGRVAKLADRTMTRVLSPAEAYLMTSLLEGVINSGTGVPARTLGVRHDVAGKTGTTNDGRDAWFVGYSPTLLALVWVGFDSGDAHGLSGAQAALPILADFMRQALEAYPSPAFTVPPGITVAEIDVTNGKLAGRFCPVVAREVFLPGTEPELCDEHRDVTDQLAEWGKRIFDWFRR